MLQKKQTKSKWKTKISPVAAKCTKVIGPAQNVARKLPSCHLSQMESDRFSAVIVIGKNAQTVPDGSNQVI